MMGAARCYFFRAKKLRRSRDFARQRWPLRGSTSNRFAIHTNRSVTRADIVLGWPALLSPSIETRYLR